MKPPPAGDIRSGASSLGSFGWHPGPPWASGLNSQVPVPVTGGLDAGGSGSVLACGSIHRTASVLLGRNPIDLG